MIAQPDIADYALLSDRHTAALIAHGSVDWLCVPRFDSAAVFSRLLGDTAGSRWLIAPRQGHLENRSYRSSSFVLDSRWRTPSGTAIATDLMPLGPVRDRIDLIRMITCTSGEIDVEVELIMRFGYGTVVPWIRQTVDTANEAVLYAQAGPDSMTLHGPALRSRDFTHVGDFHLSEGDSLAWTLTWSPSHLPVPTAVDSSEAILTTLREVDHWHAELNVGGPYAEAVTRSISVLHALTLRDTGGIVAAATTSLPESIGGERNWDYRYCWLRDSAMTISALASHGHYRAAESWRQWLLRAVAGDPDDLQIMYGVGGERELNERELSHLDGYRGSKPVRVGNAASTQHQADVIGEVMLALSGLRNAGLREDEFSWPLQTSLLTLLMERLDWPDNGIWEIRGAPRRFTQGRVMIWAALDAGVRAVSVHGLPGDEKLWRETRDRLKTEILSRASQIGYFPQHDDTAEVDASLLRIPQVGFVDYDHPLMLATVARIERDLIDQYGFVRRYRTTGIDGLPGDEGAFLMCTFWLVEQYARSGRADDGARLMEKALSTRNELGLLAEEYDPAKRSLLGNYPQAFSHLALIRAADALS